MFLQRVSEYADRLDLPPVMYQKTRIQWFIDLDSDGKLEGLTPLDSGDPKRPGRDWLAPHIGRSNGIRPKLLADTAEYVLGVPREIAKSERVTECHRQFQKLVRRCAEATSEPSVLAALAFVTSWSKDSFVPPQGFDAGDVLTFRVAEIVPIDLPAVRNFWRTETTADTSENGAEKPQMECIVCGTVTSVESVLPVKIKGIPKGQQSGTMLISANKEAFESYALHSSLIAPTCMRCGERVANGINDLLAGRNTHLRLGPLAYIFWTRDETGLDLASLFSQPDPEQVKTLLESARVGKEALGIEDTDFYAMALSASGGRVVVRDWLETTVEHVKANLASWFLSQRLVGLDGEDGLPFGIYPLAASLYRDANKEMVANVPRLLLRAALHGTPLPEWLVYQAVRRNRADAQISRPRITLTKMLLQPHYGKEWTMEELDPNRQEPAYLCGRLFAELEQVQKLAINPKATIVDRYFGTASSAPATVFGTLLRGAQAHLGKLRKTREGAFYGLQERIEEILKGLPAFPKTLALKEQALFSLGYYHQRAADRAAAKAAKENKNLANADNE